MESNPVGRSAVARSVVLVQLIAPAAYRNACQGSPECADAHPDPCGLIPHQTVGIVGFSCASAFNRGASNVHVCMRSDTGRRSQCFL
ncbi:MAG: hypothetical protein V3U75_14010 [Methylococcaceae bacterium]